MKSYKKSEYNYFRKIDEENFLLYNLFTTSIAILNKEEKQKFENIDNEFSYGLNEDELINSFIENGFILNNNVDEQTIMKINRNNVIFNSKNGHAHFVIAPTMDCNARCFYCYEKDYKDNNIMNYETADQIIKFIKERIEGTSKVNISWFGGEPSLCIDMMKYISESLIKYCTANEIEYYSHITSNGLLINRDLMEIMDRQCKINSIQIPLDGFEDDYVKRKNYINETNVFERIINNIFTLSENNWKVSLRLNLDRTNIDSIKKLCSFLINHERWNDNIKLYGYPLSSDCSCQKPSCFLNADEYEKIMSEIIEYLKEIGYYTEDREFDVPVRDIPCGALLLSNYVIGPDGSLYKCQHHIGRAEHSVGNVFEGESVNSKLYEWITTELPSECKTCLYLPVCQGGCVANNRNTVNPEACNIVKYEFEVKINHLVDSIINES